MYSIFFERNRQAGDGKKSGLRTFFENNWRLNDGEKSALQIFWNGRADSFNIHKKKSDAQYRLRLIEHVSGRCGIGLGSRVLDIGCGPGLDAFLFARGGALVTGLDVSPKMLACARENADREHAAGVDFLRMDWAEADVDKLGWRGRFDLVYASKTPAVCDRPTLEKMMSCSRGRCLLIGVAESRSSVREILKSSVPWDEEQSRAAVSVYNAFNLLWLDGYFPEINYMENSRTTETPLEDAVLIHTRAFEKIRNLSGREKRILAERISGLSEGGFIREKYVTKHMIMCWEAHPARFSV
jgi:SAM-dependent methyltransferase